MNVEYFVIGTELETRDEITILGDGKVETEINNIRYFMSKIIPIFHQFFRLISQVHFGISKIRL